MDLFEILSRMATKIGDGARISALAYTLDDPTIRIRVDWPNDRHWEYRMNPTEFDPDFDWEDMIVVEAKRTYSHWRD